METHSSVPSWRIPGTGEPGGLPSMGSHRLGQDWSNLAAAAAARHWYTKVNEKKKKKKKNRAKWNNARDWWGLSIYDGEFLKESYQLQMPFFLFPTIS